tara:strand:+ start:9982 stop:11313 length:1332 start_codon:yes stop_codon:yes gene_type:complete
MALKIIFVRHGLSSFNKEGLIQGRNDESVLTSTGKSQAIAVGKTLKGIKFDKIFSSPLKRASETTQYISKELNEECPQPLLNNELLEVDLQKWTGCKIKNLKAEFPKEYLIWQKDPEELTLEKENGSLYMPIKELFIQASSFLENCLDEFPLNEEKTILVIAHNAILRCLILNLINNPKRGFRKIKLDNASISIINIKEKREGTYFSQIECLNVTSHLKKELIPSNENSKIILVRHGETNWNLEGRFQGQIDIPLNNNGKEQAKKAREILKGIKINKAFSSFLKRPMETAEIILEGKNIKPIKVLELAEINHGLWEGKLESEINEDWEELLEQWHKNPEKVIMPEGESIQDVWERSVKAWQKICNQQEDGDITLLVAHDAVNKTIICYLMGLGYKDIWSIKQGNGGFSVFEISNKKDREIIINSINITTHLGGIIDSTASGAL